MGIQKTLGGDRLGSGNRMKQEMHDFYRSNKNLSTRFASTMAPGVLYPCYVNIATKGDTFDMDMNAFVRTVPTIGPLYGSFKLQVDVFQVPFRLYQAILHNNTTDIARKMNQVYLPQVLLGANVGRTEIKEGFKEQINYSALMRYLYQSGVGVPQDDQDFLTNSGEVDNVEIHNEILAIPMLAYYDIFKNYYANKQEENAYVIKPKIEEIRYTIQSIDTTWTAPNGNNNIITLDDESTGSEYSFSGQEDGKIYEIRIKGDFRTQNDHNDWREPLNNIFIDMVSSFTHTSAYGSIQDLIDQGVLILEENDEDYILLLIKKFPIERFAFNTITIRANREYNTTAIQLSAFPLENIDNMRKYLLTQWDLGTKVVLSNENQNYLPYATNWKKELNGIYSNTYPMNGLCVKCYQSDMFNNWLDTEWVNEITETSAIDVSNGSFTLDMLNFKKKLYDHLNRLAISGGTYDDWQEATYGDRVWGKSEKPIYCGGMSSEIEFDEVVSTAQTGENNNLESNNTLGSIAGRGKLATRKGGKITIKVGEASVIMAIASITPRIMYSQGNAWFNSELKTMDDLHKPIFDRIGFQDLMVEQMAWWDRKYYRGGNDQISTAAVIRTSAGKQPAWLNYATDIDRVFGDFANNKEGGLNYMVLTRNYEQGEDGSVADVTTYIDPQKFNYAFAYTNLDAQNFWTFIGMRIHARRKMSNTQIPNV